jgi:GNAT superfamily N-acetyltransferase
MGSMPLVEISTDPDRLDIAVIHGFLSTCYWSPGIPLETVRRAIAGSLNFGIYVDGAQAGFARIITDRATFAWLCDVFVLEVYRGQGLSKRLMEAIQAHPDLQGLRRWLLATRDAHGLYKQFGYVTPHVPGRYLDITRPNIYLS